MTNRCMTAQSTEVVRRWAPHPIVMLTAAAVLTALTAAPPADAAPRQARPEHTTEGAAPRDAGEPIMAIVSIKSQKVTFYARAGIDRNYRTRDASWRLQCLAEGQRPPLEPL